jgi:hypothetical protein
MEMTDSEAVGMLMSDDNAGWTVNQAWGLVEFLNDVHDEDNPYSMDVVALRCEFSGYKSIDEAAHDLQVPVDDLYDDALIIQCDNEEVVVQY